MDTRFCKFGVSKQLFFILSGLRYGAIHLHTATCVQKFLILQMMAISLFLSWKHSF
jgi:hypothetical protein